MPLVRIAHLSDPHVSVRHHPSHLSRLRLGLRSALERKADHIVLSGDLTSTGEERDFVAIRRLLVEFDLLHTDRVTVVPGNHDIYGGPHLAEELLGFPASCRDTNYDAKLASFLSHFDELFVNCELVTSHKLPFVKRVGTVALIGVDTNARYSPLLNPVGSNGVLTSDELEDLSQALRFRSVTSAHHRMLVAHHHFFKRRDTKRLLSEFGGKHSLSFVAQLEQETLKLRGKKRIVRLLKDADISHILHGHVHFTGSYERDSIVCVNSAGATMPIVSGTPLRYTMLHAKAAEVHQEIITISRGSSAKDGRRM